MGAYAGLSSFFNGSNGSLRDYAIRYGYDDSNIIILEGNEASLRENHLQIYNNLLSCRHHSDNRTPIQYGQDLVASWVFEDYFLNELKDTGLNISLSGADRNRAILPNRRTSTSSDYIITMASGCQIQMELVNDYTGFWARTGKLHLRDNKYPRLRDNGCLLLAIALTPQTQKYALFDFREEIHATFLPRHEPWSRPGKDKAAYELEVLPEMLQDFSITNIKDHIERILQ